MTINLIGLLLFIFGLCILISIGLLVYLTIKVKQIMDIIGFVIIKEGSGKP